MGYLTLWRWLHGAAIMSQNLALDRGEHLRYYVGGLPVSGASALHQFRVPGVREAAKELRQKCRGSFFCPF